MKELINLFVNDAKSEQFTPQHIAYGALAVLLLVVMQLIENFIANL